MFSRISVLVFLGVGCSDQGLKPCHDMLNAAITEPALNATLIEGFDLSLVANVDNLCEPEILETALYAVSSDVDGELGGEGAFEDGFYRFTLPGGLSVGSHDLSLRVIGSNSTEAEASVSIAVEANPPPTVTLATNEDDIISAPLDPGAEIVVTVTDPHEPLDSLALSWTLDGAPYDGPAFADENGNASFTLSEAEAGCQALTVTVTDMMGQSDSDSTDLILYAELEDLNDYRWWSDGDGDGWGVASTETVSCEPPDGSVAFSAAEDCDDGNADVRPGAADYCDDGIDSDCDVTTPRGCFPYGDVEAAWSDAYMEGEFLDVSGVGDINNDGFDDVAVGMMDQHMRVIYGTVRGEMFADAAFASVLTYDIDFYKGYAGYRIDGGYDATGDGVSDLILANQDWRYACQGSLTINTGRSYLLAGGESLASATLEDIASTGADLSGGDALVLGTDYTSGCYTTLSTVDNVLMLPDLDGDGLADLAVATNISDKETYGAVWLVLSSDLGDIDTEFIEDAYRLRLEGAEEGDYLGTDLASADIDGDGLSDLIVSSAPEGRAGTVYVIYARDLPTSPSTMDIRSIASLTFTGAEEGDRAGYAVSGAGDLDGDGDDELLIAAPGARSGQGVVYIVPGFYEVRGSYRLDEALPSSTSPNAQGAVQLVGSAGDGLSSVALAGDINNDGTDDLIIGAPGHSEGGDGAGAAYIVYNGDNHWGRWWDPDSGAPRDEVNLLDAATLEEHTARIYSTDDGAALGTTVDHAGDLNGDGIDDILIGPGSDGGTLRVFFGGGT